MKRHSNRIIKLVSKTYDIDERILIVKKYCYRFNNTSDGYYLDFRSGILYYSRQKFGNYFKIDISEHFSLMKIRDNKIGEILNE
jgi:hypothetical protein